MDKQLIIAVLLCVGLAQAAIINVTTNQNLVGNNYFTGKLNSIYDYRTYFGYSAIAYPYAMWNNQNNLTNLTFQIQDGMGNVRNDTVVTINISSMDFVDTMLLRERVAWNQFVLDAGGQQNAMIYMLKILSYDTQSGVCWKQ